MQVLQYTRSRKHVFPLFFSNISTVLMFWTFVKAFWRSILAKTRFGAITFKTTIKVPSLESSFRSFPLCKSLQCMPEMANRRARIYCHVPLQGLARLQNSAAGDLWVPITVLIACLVSLGIGISKVVNGGQVRHMCRSFLCAMKRFGAVTSVPRVHHLEAAVKPPDVRNDRGVPAVSAAEDNFAGVPSVDDFQHGTAVPAAVVLAHWQGHHAADCVQVSAHQFFHSMSVLMPKTFCMLTSGSALTTCSGSAILRKLCNLYFLHRSTSVLHGSAGLRLC